MEDCKSKCLNYLKNIKWQEIINRIKNLLLNPHENLNEIGAENITPKDFTFRFILPLFGILLLVDIVVWVFGGFKFEVASINIERSLVSVIVLNLQMLLMSFVMAYIFFFLAKIPFFDTKANFENSFKLVGSILLVSLTSTIIAHIISIFMSFLPNIILAAVGLYLIYIMWLGISILLESKNKVAYLISAIICCIISGTIISVPFKSLHQGDYSSKNPQLQDLENNLDQLQERLQDITRQ